MLYLTLVQPAFNEAINLKRRRSCSHRIDKHLDVACRVEEPDEPYTMQAAVRGNLFYFRLSR